MVDLFKQNLPTSVQPILTGVRLQLEILVVVFGWLSCLHKNVMNVDIA